MSVVLIVGAGASKELGIPCGQDFLWELVPRLSTSLNYNEHGKLAKDKGKYKSDMVNQFLKFYKFDLNPSFLETTSQEEAIFVHSINSFSEDLEAFTRQNNGSTIDAFLACHYKKNYTEIGKFVLAYHMIGYEAQSQREKWFCEENWLRKFINGPFLREVKSSEREMDIKIITFNYDRLIEHHIFEFLKNKIDYSDEQAKEIIEKLEIIHVYGKIACLEWQDQQDPGVGSIKFGQRNDDRGVLNITQRNIQLIGWRIEKDIEIQIRNCINAGTKFYLLGFGFDPDNMRILGLAKAAKIISTAYGLDQSKRNQINNKYDLNIDFRNDIKNERGMKCSELISDNELFSLD